MSKWFIDEERLTDPTLTLTDDELKILATEKVNLMVGEMEYILAALVKEVREWRIRHIYEGQD